MAMRGSGPGVGATGPAGGVEWTSERGGESDGEGGEGQKAGATMGEKVLDG